MEMAGQGWDALCKLESGTLYVTIAMIPRFSWEMACGRNTLSRNRGLERCCGFVSEVYTAVWREGVTHESRARTSAGLSIRRLPAEGTRMPRLPALYQPKRRGGYPSNETQGTTWKKSQAEHPWRQNYATLAGLASFMKKKGIRASANWAPQQGGRLPGERKLRRFLGRTEDASSASVDCVAASARIREQAEDIFRSAKESGQLPQRNQKGRKRGGQDRLRFRDPW